MTLPTIKIPDNLLPHVVPIGEIAPNSWNPNHMENFMREKLVRAIRTDGFIVPIIVRPETRPEKLAQGVKWEIIDGEHRWHVADNELGMTEVPIVNLGPISDSQAKQITVKANTLRGEFDSVQLATMLDDLVKDVGKSAVVEALPFTQERIDAMLALTKVDMSALNVPNLNGDENKPNEQTPPDHSQFKQFDPSSMAFEHKCPRCAFEFNSKKET